MSRMRGRLTYANVMASVAVFLALGGGAYAAINLPKNSVTTKEVKNGSLKAKDVAKKQVVKKVVYRSEVAEDLATNNSAVRDIQCKKGEIAIGGGATGTIVNTNGFPNLDIDTDLLVSGPINANDDAVANGKSATGWHVSARVTSGPRDLHLYAACAKR